jgi:hypothetical protein
MLLPAGEQFLVTNYTLNTGAILALSYGWLGLILYTLISIYYVLRPPSMKTSGRERAMRGQ